MVETQGYTCQEHQFQVTTADGYILGLQRIPKGRSGNEIADRQPVLLQHGLLLDASSWLLNPPDQSLAFILADNGFDVWLANSRGTKSSRGHTSLSPDDDPAYWDWSWDELASHDLPAFFQYVNNQTGQKLHYVGHSLGTLTALAAFSQEKLLNLLRSAALLSPVAYLGQMSSLFKLKLLGVQEFPNGQTQQLVEFICTLPGIDCSNLLATITGPNCCLSSSSKDALFKHFPKPTATKNFIHLSQKTTKLKMSNPSTTLLLLALLCVSAVAATRTKLNSINNLDDGICKSMVETQGYTCQEHEVTTADGYILGLQRIPNGRSGNETADKLPVLLQHGVFLDASSWLLNPPDQALPFILADNGFDVWLVNSRGTSPSRGHTSLSPKDPVHFASANAYWDWSWDELVAYDLPASFQYVNNQTGHKLHYVGHSLGTLTALAAFSEEKLLNLLRSAALLSPVAYLGHISSLILRPAVDIFAAEKLKLLGWLEFPNGQIQQLVEFICTTRGIDCSNLLAAIGGPNCCLNSSSIDALVEHDPQPTATKNLIHLSQIVRKGTVEMYDYGLEDTNIKHYKKPTPPVYNMANIPKDVPLFLSYGGRDSIADVSDVGILLDKLRDHDRDKLVVEYREEYAHVDFIMSVNANQVVYGPLLAFFRLH
ncbi:unnamed protein product [Prunus armeniaca]|uniref:Partial AB-hydrolase lipase domain-containing protein n=1 Tax=Prunus armeniaca TaxID=36596 RepID=A0A6J5UCR0_PRUAR|nr:unnamed protein product [Prunus armeniaca]